MCKTVRVHDPGPIHAGLADGSGKTAKNMAKRERELRQSTNVAIKDAERQRDREIREKQRSIQRLSVFVPLYPCY